MERIYKIIMLLSLLSFGSCSDFLDREPISQASENTFWRTEADVEKGLNALYPLLPNSRDFWRDCESDNSLMTNAWGESGLGFICQGSYNASTGYLTEEWTYSKVYRILYFLQRIKEMNITSEKMKRYEGEARFILALTYFRMTRHFGDIPLIKEDPVILENASLPRTSKQEVLDYVIENINKAIEYLPESYTGDDVGRINKAAAYTLKADIYLDMASIKKFHNNENASDLWKIAAESAQKVIDMGRYDLENDYAFLFTTAANNNNKEVILAYQYKENEITHMLPILASPAGTGISGNGWASFCPTRGLVDSYLCVDGKTIYDSPLYNMNKPWENRDKRLKETFMLPGVDVLRPDGKYTPYMPHPAYNMPEQMNREGGGITGFMYLKYNEPTSLQPWNSFINFNLYRYAEVLLISAEALNEYVPSDTRIVFAVNKVRNRAGLPNLTGSETQAEMREIIREERRHEFVCEHKRYFDILRWKTAEKVLNEPGYGINKDATKPIGDYNQEKFMGQSRFFDTNKNYLWPIPQTALDKNQNLTQTTGW